MELCLGRNSPGRNSFKRKRDPPGEQQQVLFCSTHRLATPSDVTTLAPTQRFPRFSPVFSRPPPWQVSEGIRAAAVRLMPPRPSLLSRVSLFSVSTLLRSSTLLSLVVRMPPVTFSREPMVLPSGTPVAVVPPAGVSTGCQQWNTCSCTLCVWWTGQASHIRCMETAAYQGTVQSTLPVMYLSQMDPQGPWTGESNDRLQRRGTDATGGREPSGVVMWQQSNPPAVMEI
jgi:hypothetical protein